MAPWKVNMDEDGYCIHMIDPLHCTICNGRDKRDRTNARFELRDDEIGEWDG